MSSFRSAGLVGAPEPLEGSDAAAYPLDAAACFLNHGSFGSPRREVLARQDAWRGWIEADPIERLGRGVREWLAASREQVASFVGADPAGIGFVTNATEGVNAVVRSIAWRRGDRIVTTDHVYHAVRQTLRRIAAESGAELVEVPLPAPFGSPAEIAARVEEALAPATRLLVIDHVTSPTAVVFPVERLVACCRRRGIEVLVDGAHGPGMLPLDLASLDADHYAANLHKWVGAPKGAGFLFSHARVRGRVHPLVTSHFFGEGFAREFDWQGTRDVTPWIVAGEAIEAGRRCGWPAIRRHNHALAIAAQAMLAARWQVETLTPLDGSMLGSMAAIPLPPAVAARFGDAEAVQAELRRRGGIEVPVIPWTGGLLVRISAAPYNRPWQYEHLAACVESLAAR
jgi:isopenicillin-N epimerase